MHTLTWIGHAAIFEQDFATAAQRNREGARMCEAGAVVTSTSLSTLIGFAEAKQPFCGIKILAALVTRESWKQIATDPRIVRKYGPDTDPDLDHALIYEGTHEGAKVHLKIQPR